ncbi:Lon protease (S16) C-terminal proteolytic domain-containing protein [Desulfacinum infernum DSM 9756]|uniref:Lon protease (S16) C-terminal proteolytic domain-containing protein n=1 Tax=Desulfacinum infernum DSM 9756 TaxID=1121391 RepID=A0A1M5AS37_9BACT|nr:S16 family serine protease [Desulfacinum infernum]SHF32976.1 Lon protease (S16) C-terminal proteolytic domain-containing protein [Desulfacinum infernum DSM 9756]
MREFSSWSLDELLVWQSWGCLEERLEQVRDPRLFRAPREEGEFAEQLHALLQAVPDHVGRLVTLSCLAAGIGRKGREGIRAFGELPGIPLPLLLGLPDDWPDLRQASLSVVPIPVASGDRGDVVWALVGAAPLGAREPFPPWCRQMLDPHAREALILADRLLQSEADARLLFLPILLPPTEASGGGPAVQPRMCGPSLALPVLLGALDAKRRRGAACEPGDVAATGSLDQAGRILPVAGLEAKTEAAARFGFRAMIVPAEAARDRKAGGRMEFLEAGDLQTAWYLWESCRRERGSRRLKDLDRLRSPEDLAAGVHRMDPRMAGWSRFQRTYRETLGRIWTDADHAASFVKQLERMSRDPSVPVHWLAELLDPVDESVVAGLAKISAVAAFRLAQCAWAVATRRGDPGEAARWAACCESLCDSVVVFDRGLYLVGDFWNRRFITERHALYRFDPQLSKPVQEIVGRLESCRDAQRMGDTVPVIPALAKLYGTIAQNYGFCGPDYLADTRRYVDLALEAFGGDGVPPFQQDRKRQLHYLLHALLDAGRLEEAEGVLQRYLGRKESDLSPYEHAALARFGAETGRFPPGYRAACRSLLRKGLEGHPWQLWLWNVGRILTDAEGKRLAWEQGLRLCSRLGPTARPMGLLHAAWLWKEGLAPAEKIRTTVEEILADLENGPLWKDHFRPLLSARSWAHALEEILAASARYFPFTYR